MPRDWEKIADEKFSVIKKGALLVGNIECRQPLIIRGTVIGDVTSSELVVVLGLVSGTVKAPLILTKAGHVGSCFE